MRSINLLSHSSSDSNKYKRAWLKAKVIRFSILSAGERPDACSRELSIAGSWAGISCLFGLDGPIARERQKSGRRSNRLDLKR